MTAVPDKPIVLVTRPAHQAQKLCELLTRAGFDAHAVPAIEILPAADPDAVRAAIGDPLGYDVFVFVSTNAVRHGREFLPTDGHLPGIVAAVGPSTARALERAGLRCDVTPAHGYTSEDLLAQPPLQDVDGKRVLILRGSGGRALLGDTLGERGATVVYAEVYLRRAPAASGERLRARLDAGDVDVITATSVETLCNIVEMADCGQPRPIRDVTVLTASPRVATKAAELGFVHPALLADGPDDVSLVTALERWHGDAATGAGPEHAGDRPGLDAPPAETTIMASDDKHDGGDVTGTAGESADARTETSPVSERQPAEPAPDAPGTGDGAAAASPAVEPAVAPARPSRGGRLLGLLAVVLALLALAASGYVWWSGQAAGEQLARDLDARLDGALANLPDGDALIARARSEAERAGQDISRDVEQRLSRIDTSAIDELREAQQQADSQVRGQRSAVAALSNRVGGLEDAVGAMQGVSMSVRNTWVRAEAEYFLQTANSRLQLAGDLDSALQALRAADERIGSLGDPGLTPVRALLTEEILSVEGVPRPDRQGMALVLNGMVPRVRELPFRDRTPDNFAVERAAETDTPNGWQRAREAVGEVFTGIVRVSPSDGSTLQLLTADESWFLVRQLELQLQVARVALMERDVQNFKGSVRNAIVWLDDHFDAEDQAVRSMRARLVEMEQVDVDPALPDISGSLRLLREIVAESGTSQ